VLLRAHAFVPVTAISVRGKKNRSLENAVGHEPLRT
jgi:hypothetical protein